MSEEGQEKINLSVEQRLTKVELKVMAVIAISGASLFVQLTDYPYLQHAITFVLKFLGW